MTGLAFSSQRAAVYRRPIRNAAEKAAEPILDDEEMVSDVARRGARLVNLATGEIIEHVDWGPLPQERYGPRNEMRDPVGYSGGQLDLFADVTP